MARHSQLIRINFTGGIISPGHLQTVLQIAQNARAESFRFGLRQELFLEVPQATLERFRTDCRSQDIQFHTAAGRQPNITSSFPGAGIFGGDSWLTEGIYKDVFDLFQHAPQRKVNICDAQQTFNPFFSGHLNWISSPYQNYWYLYLRKPGDTELYCWPALIYTNSIAAVSQAIEARMGEAPPEEIAATLPDYIHRPLEAPLQLPAFRLPYYEGFNRHGSTYWLGIYRRDETFPPGLLQDICTICLENGIGQLYATPWKSLIIKNIDPGHRHLWDFVLGKYNINVRHAANELNWQVADNCEDSLVLKRHIIRHFDTADVRTYGLCFTIRLHDAGNRFGSIIVQRQKNRYDSKLKYMQRYDILYKEDFNPNSHRLATYRGDVQKEHLGPYLAALCRQYYEQGSQPAAPPPHARTPAAALPVAEKPLHQCPVCQTVYDGSLGDELRQIPAGTAFSDLPADYGCYLCGTGKANFVTVTAASLAHPDTHPLTAT